MELAALTATRYEANDQLRRMRGAGKLSTEQRAMRRALVHMRQGRRVVHLLRSINATGSDELMRPRIAVAPLEMAGREVWLRAGWWRPRADGTYEREVMLQRTQNARHALVSWRQTQEREGVRLPPSCTLVPEPPACVMRAAEGYSRARLWILTEADWKAAPHDPALLLRLSRYLFAVLDTWDLTELERLALGMGV